MCHAFFVRLSVCRELPAALPGPRPPCARGQGLTRSLGHQAQCPGDGSGLHPRGRVCHCRDALEWCGACHPLPAPPLLPRRMMERGAGEALSSSWGGLGGPSPPRPCPRGAQGSLGISLGEVFSPTWLLSGFPCASLVWSCSGQRARFFPCRSRCWGCWGCPVGYRWTAPGFP